MTSSVFTFPTDFVDEGADIVLDRFTDAGIDGVTLAALYHHARDVFPHNPRRKIVHMKGGQALFRPQPGRYRDPSLAPPMADLVAGLDPLQEMRELTRKRDMSLTAWTVLLHDSHLGWEEPDLSVENLFGDKTPPTLCPSHPRVREYAADVISDLGRYGCDAVLLESYHFHPFEHGYHHERYLFHLGAADRTLLGLCFCPHCRVVTEDAGVDVDSLAQAARRRLVSVFADPERAEDIDDSEELGEGLVARYQRARASSVTTLVEDLAARLDGTGTRLELLDPTGSYKGYATGNPTGAPSADEAWRFGLDLSALSRVADTIHACAYARESDRVGLDLARLRDLANGGCRLGTILRPWSPDSDDSASLAAKIRVARELGVTQLGFYHYSLLPLTALERIKAALTGVAGSGA